MQCNVTSTKWVFAFLKVIKFLIYKDMNHMMLVCNFIFYLKHFLWCCKFALRFSFLVKRTDSKDSSIFCHWFAIKLQHRNIICMLLTFARSWLSMFYWTHKTDSNYSFRWFTCLKFKYLCNKTLRYPYEIVERVTYNSKIMHTHIFFLAR